MSTTTLKPRPVYKQARTTKKRTMTEQTKPSLSTPYVQSHLSDIQLIERNALWDDFKNRMKINNREVGYAMKQLRDVVNHTHKFALPYVDKAVEYVKSKQQ
tara:strand:- start:3445 stop:3747 length:303 start_codon:yes stop_codon:yes gene_type:complete